eukprot:748065-Hanusia_phi.AAC.1
MGAALTLVRRQLQPTIHVGEVRGAVQGIFGQVEQRVYLHAILRKAVQTLSARACSAAQEHQARQQELVSRFTRPHAAQTKNGLGARRIETTVSREMKAARLTDGLAPSMRAAAAPTSYTRGRGLSTRICRLKENDNSPAGDAGPGLRDARRTNSTMMPRQP